MSIIFENALMTLEEMSVFESERHRTKAETMATRLLSKKQDRWMKDPDQQTCICTSAERTSTLKD